MWIMPNIKLAKLFSQMQFLTLVRKDTPLLVLQLGQHLSKVLARLQENSQAC